MKAIAASPIVDLERNGPQVIDAVIDAEREIGSIARDGVRCALERFVFGAFDVQN